MKKTYLAPTMKEIKTRLTTTVMVGSGEVTSTKNQSYNVQGGIDDSDDDDWM